MSPPNNQPANPPIDPAAVCLRIRTLVEFNGTVAEVAETCGIKLPTLETVIYGKGLPGAMTLACLSRGLQVSTDWLLFGAVTYG